MSVVKLDNCVEKDGIIALFLEPVASLTNFSSLHYPHFYLLMLLMCSTSSEKQFSCTKEIANKSVNGEPGKDN